LVAAFVAVYVLIVLALTYVVKRWLHTGLAVLVWLGGTVYLAYSILHGLWYCSRPPVWIEPAPEAGGDGTYVFNCDSAGGLITYSYNTVFGPLGVGALLVAGWFLMKSHMSSVRKINESI
jgi:hypothetical protein